MFGDYRRPYVQHGMLDSIRTDEPIVGEIGYQRCITVSRRRPCHNVFLGADNCRRNEAPFDECWSQSELECHLETLRGLV